MFQMSSIRDFPWEVIFGCREFCVLVPVAFGKVEKYRKRNRGAWWEAFPEVRPLDTFSPLNVPQT